MWGTLYNALKTVFQLAVVATVGYYGWQVYVDHQARAEAASAVPNTRPAPVASDVSALGRIAPYKGLRSVHGPSTAGVAVVAELRVEEGDAVQAGDIIATIDTESVLLALVQQGEAELAHAQLERQRSLELAKDNLAAQATADLQELRVQVAEASLKKVQTDLALSRVRTPVGGRVVRVHARDGEAIGSNGILELAQTDRMYAVAEVYETDIRRIDIGQRAEARSPALAEPLFGVVEYVHLKVEKQDSIGTDPAARQDARVIEVEIRLDDPVAASAFTNLQVEVVISASIEAEVSAR